MVDIKGYNNKGECVWHSVVSIEHFNTVRRWVEQDAINHGAVRVVVDMAL